MSTLSRFGGTKPKRYSLGLRHGSQVVLGGNEVGVAAVAVLVVVFPG